jgi:hypothetical protein
MLLSKVEILSGAAQVMTPRLVDARLWLAALPVLNTLGSAPACLHLPVLTVRCPAQGVQDGAAVISRILMAR